MMANSHFEISSAVVCTDHFMAMSTDAQALYFHLCSHVFSKGICCNPRSICKGMNIPTFIIDELLENKYINEVEEGVRICHWQEHRGLEENHRQRNTYENRIWRKNVLERDGYRCSECGSMENLEAHHIKPFAKYPEYRAVVNNGITLCHECHVELHNKERERGRS